MEATGIAVCVQGADARTESPEHSSARLCVCVYARRAYRPIDEINLHNVYTRKCMFHNALSDTAVAYGRYYRAADGGRSGTFLRDTIRILDRIFAARRKRGRLMTSMCNARPTRR